ncbi:MAG TPA: type IV toxin-antitoxin system AbiEi family antitoxin domain-containing protein, partial [Actinomycetota bacterium]|nr:type IV toxin-antitoxin system AbiEi family antitoxin domain-containing protein [Actinomycetota bacterium]
MKTRHNGGFSLTEEQEPHIRALAATQFGVIGRDQAVAAGLGDNAVQYRVRSGRWQRCLPGVYLIVGTPGSWQQRLKAAELWAGDAAVVSHRAAAAVWRLDGIEPGTLELLTTSTRCNAPKGIILHRTKVLARRDWADYGGFRVTGLARTLFDLAGVVDPATFEAAAESALRRNRNLYGDLVARLDELGRQGRNGVAAVREFLAARDPDAA